MREERVVGVEEARSQLGRLLEEIVETGEPIVIAKRGQAVGVLVSRSEYSRLKLIETRAAREELAAMLEQTRKNVADAGIDPADVDEVIKQVRALQ